VDHAEAGLVAVRSGGRLGVAMLVLLAVVGGGLVLDRTEPKAMAPIGEGAAPSGAWLCPHGGGKDWTTQLYLANPGADPVDVRVTSLGDAKPSEPSSYTVDAGAELRIPAEASDPAASSFVEYFGGWVAAGWVAKAGGGQSGVAAEPCASEAGTRWLAPDGTTEQGQNANLIVMNPFDVVAVVDVAIYTDTRAPIRDSGLTDQEVPPHRSISLSLNRYALDEPAAAAEVRATAGRVAVASLGVGDDGGIRSALAVTGEGVRRILPSTNDPGQSTLVVVAPGDEQVRFGAVLYAGGEAGPAGGLTGQSQSGRSAHAYPVITDGASAVDVRALAGSPPFAVVRRVEGPGNDAGATGGVPGPAPSWIVLPTVAGEPSSPGVVLTNPGAQEMTVTLTRMTATGADTDTLDVVVAAGASVAVASRFLEVDPTGAVLAVSQDGSSFVAAGASSSLGKLGIAGFAVSAGVPLPPGRPPG
jgi:hypothetical protein